MSACPSAGENDNLSLIYIRPFHSGYTAIPNGFSTIRQWIQLNKQLKLDRFVTTKRLCYNLSVPEPQLQGEKSVHAYVASANKDTEPKIYPIILEIASAKRQIFHSSFRADIR